MILVISDIHGNANALRAIIADARQKYDIQKYAILGDMFTLGPAPLEVFEEIEKLPNFFFIRGNHEDYLLDRLHENNCPKIGNFDRGTKSYEKLRSSLQRTYQTLGSERLKYIDGICLNEHILEISKVKHYFCHASPQTNKVGIDPSEAEKYLESIQNGCFWAGHVHHQILVRHQHKTFINPGGSGLPFDGDHRAPYAIIDSKGLPHIHRIAYNYQDSIQQLNQFPNDLFAPFMQKRYEYAKSVKHLLDE